MAIKAATAVKSSPLPPFGLARIGHVVAWTNSSKSTVYRLIKSGVLPKPMKVGRSLAWRVIVLRAWLDALDPNTEIVDELVQSRLDLKGE